mgnify:CR=1 FL=1
MRGKAQDVKSDGQASRITPAYAGKKFPSFLLAVRPKDHPRMCGEKCSPRGMNSAYSGLPPRMRGKDFRNLVEVPFVGITPAHAGKRLASGKG